MCPGLKISQKCRFEAWKTQIAFPDSMAGLERKGVEKKMGKGKGWKREEGQGKEKERKAMGIKEKRNVPCLAPSSQNPSSATARATSSESGPGHFFFAVLSSSLVILMNHVVLNCFLGVLK